MANAQYVAKVHERSNAILAASVLRLGPCNQSLRWPAADILYFHRHVTTKTAVRDSHCVIGLDYL